MTVSRAIAIIPPRPVVQTWRVSIWDIGLTTFLVEVYDDHTWRLTRIGLQRLGDRGSRSGGVRGAGRVARHADPAPGFAGRSAPTLAATQRASRMSALRTIRTLGVPAPNPRSTARPSPFDPAIGHRTPA